MDSDYLPIGEVLKRDFSYRVPAHQRDFSWTPEETKQLWDDLMEAILHPDQTYFLGTIVVQQDNKSRSLIDGQQRLASITAIYSAIRTIYKEHGDEERAAEIMNAYLGSRHRKTREMIPKLTLNETNEPAFRNMVVDEADDAAISQFMRVPGTDESNVLLCKALLYFRTKIRDRVAVDRSYDTFLITLEDFLSDCVSLIVFVVDDEADAYLFFETVNDRGLDLSTSDLLKNFLFGRAGNRNLNEVKTQWNKLSNLIGAANLTQFLRHYWLSKYEVIRERELYKEMKSKFSTAQAVLDLMPDLVNAAQKYHALTNVDDEVWNEYDTQVKEKLEWLKLLGVTQYKPLLLACLDVLDPATVRSVIHMVLVITVRYSVIGALGTGNIEKAYSDAARAVRDRTATGISAIFNILKHLYPEDAKFRTDFETKSITKAKIARYLLAAITQKEANEPGRLRYMDETQYTLEHILPKNLTDDWTAEFFPSGLSDDELQKFHDAYLNRLGNMALAEDTLNRDLGNSPYSTKKAAFASSGIATTATISDPSWTPEAINKRQTWLASRAVSIWRVDYSQ